MDQISYDILENSPTAIISYKTEDRSIMYLNKLAENFINEASLYDIENKFKVSQSFYDLFINKGNGQQTFDFVKKNKHKNYIINHKSMFLNGHDTITLYIYDNTEYYKIVLDINKERERLESLINNSPSAVCLFKWDGNTITPLVIGEVFVKLLGMPIVELMNKNISDFFKSINPEDLFVFSSELRHALFESKRLLGVYKLYNFIEQQYHSVLIDAVFIPQNDGSQFINSCFTDISIEMEKSRLLNEANSKIKLIYEHIPGAIFSCKFDKNLTLLYANDEFYSYLAYNTSSFRKIHNNKLIGVMYEEDRIKLEELIRSKIRTKGHGRIVYEMRFKTNTNELKWVFLSGELLEDDDANPYCYFVFVDITQFKLQQIKLENEHCASSDLIENIPYGIISLNIENELKILDANKYAFQKLGFLSKDELISLSFYSLFDENQNETIIKLKELNKQEFTLVIKEKSGNLLEVNAMFVHINCKTNSSIIYFIFK